MEMEGMLLGRRGVRRASYFASRLHEQELSALAGLDRPVTVSGMPAVHALVTDGGSPLFDRAAEGEISDVLGDVRALLEPR